MLEAGRPNLTAECAVSALGLSATLLHPSSELRLVKGRLIEDEGLPDTCL